MIGARQPQEALSRLARERRDDPRVAIDLDAELKSNGFDFPLEVAVRDLSAGGACIVSESPVALSEISGLRIDTGRHSLSFSAEALWQEKRQDALYTGLRFTNPQRADQRMLMDLIFETTRDIVDFLIFESSLSGMGRGDALHMAGASRLRKIEAGAWLYWQDRPTADSESIFLILDGSIRVRSRVEGRERDLADLKRGDIFGGLSSLAGVAPPESATAEMPTTLIELDVRAISFLLEQRPWLIHRLSQAIFGGYIGRTGNLLSRVAG
jgi:hypothetical protein